MRSEDECEKRKDKRERKRKRRSENRLYEKVAKSKERVSSFQQKWVEPLNKTTREDFCSDESLLFFICVPADGSEEG